MRQDASVRSGDVAPYLAFGLFAIVAGIVLFTFRDYGVTWDEEFQKTYGEYIISWYQSLFSDRRAVDFWLLKYYGGLFDLIANSLFRFSPFGIYETRHLVNAAFAMLGVFYTYRIGVYLENRLFGLVAALFLLLIPVYYGHAFNNSKDIPFAALFTVAIFYLTKLVAELPSISWRTTLQFAVATGLTLAVRVGGVLLFVLFAVVVTAWAVVHWRESRRLNRVVLGTFVVRCMAFVVVAYVIMLSAWPAAQVRPLRHPLETYAALSHFDWQHYVFFEGRNVLATQLPWYYLPKWFLIGLPEFIIAGLLLALGWLVFRIRRYRSLLSQPMLLEHAVPAVAFVVPVLVVFVTRPTLYDGMRHFLFVVPCIALLSAFGWMYCMHSLRGRARVVFAVLLVALMGSTLRDMIVLHPNEYIYFNRAIAGGLKQASLSYETDYWGNTYREGVMWISAHYDAPKDRRIRVTSCSHPVSTLYFLPRDRFKYVSFRKGRADLFLATTRNGCNHRFEGRIVHVVTRQGTPLLYVKELSDFAGMGRRGRKLAAGPEPLFSERGNLLPYPPR